jgi:hypothetical protein
MRLPGFCCRAADDPDILDRSAFEHPAEVPFAIAAPDDGAIFVEPLDEQVPAAD